jgi:Fe-S-cluster containining protein
MTTPQVLTTDDLPETNDKRASHELSPDENADLCAGCQKCCSYITVEIDSPRAAEDYDQWIWALYHEHISIFVEKPEKWYLQVDTLCGKLDKKGRCSIYGSHPVLCREYDARQCERRYPLLDIQFVFNTGEELENWIRERRPGHFKNLLKFRDAHPVGGASPATSLVQISPISTNGGPKKRPSVAARGSSRKPRSA